MEKETQEKMHDLQVFEQNLQGLLMQKQGLHAQLSEMDVAMNELKPARETYRIVGGIMVLSKKEDIIESLNQKKKMFELRLKKIDEQEKIIQEKAKRLQSYVVSEMRGKDVKK